MSEIISVQKFTCYNTCNVLASGGHAHLVVEQDWRERFDCDYTAKVIRRESLKCTVLFDDFWLIILVENRSNRKVTIPRTAEVEITVTKRKKEGTWLSKIRRWL